MYPNFFSSRTILVFDWEGNPVKTLKLNHEAYYIAVSEKQGRMYIAIKNEDEGWRITSYKLDD
jgi:6-phosphogluconolactonase (cycloisomerase 2 family)